MRSLGQMGRENGLRFCSPRIGVQVFERKSKETLGTTTEQSHASAVEHLWIVARLTLLSRTTGLTESEVALA